MKTISLRSGIITMIILLIVHTVVYVFGPFVCESIVQKGFARDTVITHYDYILFGTSVIRSLGYIVLGILMAQTDRKNLLFLWGSRLMAIMGIISLVYVIIAFVASKTSILSLSADIKVPFLIANNLCGWAALIMIACYYGKNKLIRLAIMYIILSMISKGHYVWALLTQENYHPNYALGLFLSLIGSVLILIYFFKWLKLTQTETE